GTWRCLRHRDAGRRRLWQGGERTQGGRIGRRLPQCALRARRTLTRKGVEAAESRRPSENLDGRREDIAGAAYRLDDRRLGRIGLQLAAQAPDLDVDGPVERPGFAVPGEVEQAVAAQHLVGIVDESSEQVELAGGQADLAAFGRNQLARREVEMPAGEPGART